MSEFSEELQAKISNARLLNDVPSTHSMVSYGNIGELLEEQVDKYEQKPFLIYYSDQGQRKEFSYREFYEECCKAANFFTEVGMKHGDRVVTFSFNHSDVVIQSFAAFLVGAVVVPINIDEDDKRVAYILETSNAKVALVRDQFVERFKSMGKQVRGLTTVVQVGKKVDASSPHFHSELAKQGSTYKGAKLPSLHDEALIVYTSGTTGLPKGVILTHYNLLVGGTAMAEWHHISEDQRMMCSVPIHHVNGTIVSLMTPLYAGCGMVLSQKFHSEKFFERISIEKVTVASVVPALLQFLLRAKLSTDAYKLAHLRHIICGASPLTVGLALRFEHEFKIPVIHGYSLTETTGYSSCLPIDLSKDDRKFWLSKHVFPSIGVPLPVNEMAIHDQDGREMVEGEKGEIVIRGHNVMKGYLQDRDANEVTFAHGWLRTGDEGFFQYDDQGRKFFFVTGRMGEIISREGVNISPLEIDEVLMRMPGVQAGIAVGFENDSCGEEVGAYVKPRDETELNEEDVLSYCRKKLPFSKSPKVVVFGSDIPATSTGGYQRNKCKDLFLKWKSVQFVEKG